MLLLLQTQTHDTQKNDQNFRVFWYAFQSFLCLYVYLTLNWLQTCSCKAWLCPSCPSMYLKWQTIVLVKGDPLGGKGLTGPICSSPFLNLFPPRPALCYFTLMSNARRFYTSRESLWVGKGYEKISQHPDFYIIN